MKSRIIATVGLFVVGASMMAYSQGGPSLQGAWRVTEVVATGPNAEANKSPQPGLYLFTKQHYSIVSVGARSHGRTSRLPVIPPS